MTEISPGCEPAPVIEVAAVQTGVVPDVDWTDGRPLVLIFHTKEQKDAGQAIAQAVRNRYPFASQVVTANVIDLRMFPKRMRRVVQSDLARAYQVSEGALAGNKDPESHVIILPDHEGTVHDDFGIDASGRTVSVRVIDQQWRIALATDGPGSADRTVAALQRIGAK